MKESAQCLNVNLITTAWLCFTYYWTYFTCFNGQPNQCRTI